MVRLLAVLMLAGIAPYQSNSQIWVEDYQFNGSELNSQKWTYFSVGSPNLTFNGLSMNFNISSPDRFVSVQPRSSITWYQSLPLSQSWSIVQRFKSNFIEPRMSSIEIGVYTRGATPGGLGLTASYYSDGLENTVDGWSVGGWTNGNLGMISNLADDNYYWMGISHDFDSKSLFNIFSFTSTSSLPNNSFFQTVGNSASTVGKENLNVDVRVSCRFSYSGSYDLSDFKIVPYSVPEPSSLSLLLAGGAVLMAGRRGNKG